MCTDTRTHAHAHAQLTDRANDAGVTDDVRLGEDTELTEVLQSFLQYRHRFCRVTSARVDGVEATARTRGGLGRHAQEIRIARTHGEKRGF